MMKSARKSIAILKNSVTKKKEDEPLVQSELCSLVRDIEIGDEAGEMVYTVFHEYFLWTLNRISISHLIAIPLLGSLTT